MIRFYDKIEIKFYNDGKGKSYEARNSVV